MLKPYKKLVTPNSESDGNSFFNRSLYPIIATPFIYAELFVRTGKIEYKKGKHSLKNCRGITPNAHAQLYMLLIKPTKFWINKGTNKVIPVYAPSPKKQKKHMLRVRLDYLARTAHSE